MLRKAHLFTLPTLLASVFLLTGCPPPSVSVNEVVTPG